MKVKVFDTGNTQALNEFISTVDLMGEAPIQVTSEHEIVVFYQDKLNPTEYKLDEATKSIDQLRKNLVVNELNLMNFEIELELAMKNSTSEVRVNKRALVKTAKENIELITLKIKAHEGIIKDN